MMINRITTSLMVFLCIFLFNSGALSAFGESALLRINIDKDRFLDTEFLYTDIEIISPADSFKSAMAIVNYDPLFLEIAEIDFDNSFCTLNAFTVYDNSAGLAGIVCGHTETNKSASSTLVSIKFIKKQIGLTKISLTDSQVLSNEEKPRNIAETIENHYIYIIK